GDRPDDLRHDGNTKHPEQRRSGHDRQLPPPRGGAPTRRRYHLGDAGRNDGTSRRRDGGRFRRGFDEGHSVLKLRLKGGHYRYDPKSCSLVPNLRQFLLPTPSQVGRRPNTGVSLHLSENACCASAAVDLAPDWSPKNHPQIADFLGRIRNLRNSTRPSSSRRTVILPAGRIPLTGA